MNLRLRSKLLLVLIGLSPFLALETYFRLTYHGRHYPEPLTTPDGPKPLRFEALTKLVQTSAADPHELRVVITGGSVAYGWGASSEEMRFPPQLQEILRARYPDKNIRVINAGVPDFHAMDELTLYLYFLRKLKPNVVVMVTGYNDLWDSGKAKLMPYADQRLRRWAEYDAISLNETKKLFVNFLNSLVAQLRYRLRTVSKFYEFLDDKILDLDYRPVKNLSEFDLKSAEQDLGAFSDSVRAFHSIAVKNHATFLVVIQPIRALSAVPQKEFPISRFEAKLKLMYTGALKPELIQLKKEGIDVFDLNETIVNDLVRNHLYLDFCHLKDEGNRQLALAVSEILRFDSH